jgi:hypothetical protein
LLENDNIDKINVTIRLIIDVMYKNKKISRYPSLSYFVNDMLCINPNSIVIIAAKKPSIVKLNVAKIIAILDLCGNSDAAINML